MLDINCTGNCLLGIPLAFVPSAIWLIFFAFQDKHREKIGNLIEIAGWGVLVALPVVVVEYYANRFFPENYAESILLSVAFSFLFIAFVEEFGKYIVVKLKAITRDFFDEPQDAVIYMVAAALGFAAIENLSYALKETETLVEFFSIILFRGITSTFLHVAASGTLGYFLALSIINKKEGKKFLLVGLVLATLLHGIYNSFIIEILGRMPENAGVAGTLNVFLLSALLVVSGIILITGLNKLVYIKFSSGKSKK